VYYLYSRFEENEDDIGLKGDGLEIYFDAVARDFRATETYRATQPEYRLYVIEPR
jgi:hypothetical protein